MSAGDPLLCVCLNHWVHSRPQHIPRKLEPAQTAFIVFYLTLLKQKQANDVVLFSETVRPLHEKRPIGCCLPIGTKLALPRTNGRNSLNVQGSIDMETGRTAC